MHLRRAPLSSAGITIPVLAAAFFTLIPGVLLAQGQGKKKNPSSKVYVSDVNGEALIDTGDAIEDLTKRSVYTAEGTTIETKRPDNENDRSKYFSTMVYSNGTGAFFDADTRVEVKRFVQEPFTPNRNDNDVEPSISQTSAFVSRGAVGLCNSKLVAGSNMNYQTQHGAVNIRGRKVVIETNANETKISMLEGDSTVRAGAKDLGGHTLLSGEQAIIRPGAAGQPNQIIIQKIPQADVKGLDERVAMACAAKRTVYFDVGEKKNSDGNNQGGNGNGGASDSGGNGNVDAFNGNNGDNSGTPGGGNVIIIPVETLPTDLPVQYTVSPASLNSQRRNGGGGN